MTHVPKAAPFNRLMIGQDVGSAIKGPERGDIYFGSGDAAGKVAGVTKHPGKFFVLVPKDPSAKAEAAPGESGGAEDPAMSRTGGKSAGRRPHSRPDEAELWDRVARSVDKVEGQAARPLAASDPCRSGAGAVGCCASQDRAPPATPAVPNRPAATDTAGLHRLPSSIAALSARSRPARPRSTRASTCTACASATRAHAVARVPACGAGARLQDGAGHHRQG